MNAIAIWLTIIAALAMMDWGDARASASVTFDPRIEVSGPWIIPIVKIGAGSDLNAKVGHLYQKCMKTLNRPQCVRLVALVDHESAGSWSPTINGDGGCSVGIAQWNRCAGRIASPTFDGQVDQLIAELGKRMARHSLDDATCQWNSPAMRCGRYVEKVKRSESNFI